MFKITGLDKLQKALNALKDIDGEIGTVKFNPNEPSSIEAAIVDMENLIDSRITEYSNNSIVKTLTDEMKEKYRTAILDKAAQARLKGNSEDAE